VELNFSDAAPLMCVSMTTFNALRHSGANPGDKVAIVGLAGLGHLAVQCASKMGLIRPASLSGGTRMGTVTRMGLQRFLCERMSHATNRRHGPLIVGG